MATPFQKQPIFTQKDSSIIHHKNTAELADKSNHSLKFSLFDTYSDTPPARLIDFDDLAGFCKTPVTYDGGEIKELKSRTPCFLSCDAAGKTVDVTEGAQFSLLVADIDEGNRSLADLVCRLELLECRALIYSTLSSASHSQRWRVVIPISSSVLVNEWGRYAQALRAYLGGDPAMDRKTQLSFIPAKSSPEALYQWQLLDKFEAVDLADQGHPLTSHLNAILADIEAAEAERIKAAIPKPRIEFKQVGVDGIINSINQSYNLEEILLQYGYKRAGRKYKSPCSQSGIPGVALLDDGKRCYSHHGTGDPLSASNNSGHSLDAADVLCALRYSGDFSRMVLEEARTLDPEGQKQRQCEYRRAKAAEENSRVADEILSRATEKANVDQETGEILEGEDAQHTGCINLTGLVGEYQQQIYSSMIYADWNLAGFTALAHFDAFCGVDFYVKTHFGKLSLNSLNIVTIPTGGGKESLLRPLESALEGFSLAGGGNHAEIEWSFPASAQGLHEAIESTQNKSITIFADEFGLMMRKAQKDPTKEGALSYLMQISTKPFGTVLPGRAITRKYEPIKNPRVSLIGTTTMETLTGSLDKDKVDSGFLGRIVFFSTDTIPPKNWDREHTDFELMGRRIAEHFHKFKGEKQVKFSDAGLKLYRKIDDSTFEPLKRQGTLAGLCGRLGEQTCVIAAKIALSAGSAFIEPEHFQQAADIRLWLHDRFVAALKKSDASFDGLHETGSAAEQLSQVLRKAGAKGVFESKFPYASRKFGKLSIRDQMTVKADLLGNGVAVTKGKLWLWAGDHTSN